MGQFLFASTDVQILHNSNASEFHIMTHDNEQVVLEYGQMAELIKLIEQVKEKYPWLVD